MDEKILHELEETKKMVDELRLERERKEAVAEYRGKLLHLAVEALKVFVAPVVASVVTHWLLK